MCVGDCVSLVLFFSPSINSFQRGVQCARLPESTESETVTASDDTGPSKT